MKKYIGLIMVPIAIGILPPKAPAQVVMTGSYYMVLDGGSSASPTALVLTNPAPAAITNNGSGWIVSENEFNEVLWNIGTTTGTYVVPFGYGNTDYLPLTCDITTAGVGSGNIAFSTYHCSTWDNALYEPSVVTNMNDFNQPNYSKDAVDRFWVLATSGYSTKPAPDLTFTYIRSGGSSEIAAPNYIVEPALIAQRFNTSLNQWHDWLGITGSDVTSSSTGTVSSGPVSASDFYRSWCLFNDSNLTTGVVQVNNGPGGISIYPNPGNGNFTVTGVSAGQVVQLYNYLGQLMSSAVAENSSTMHLDISTSADGIYLMRIQDKDGNVITTRKIVKTD
jgi:hypothetical protein